MNKKYNDVVIKGFVAPLGATVRECCDCGCLIAGEIIRCNRCFVEGPPRSVLSVRSSSDASSSSPSPLSKDSMLLLQPRQQPFSQKLHAELIEKLPPHLIEVDLNHGQVTYYDYHGVTFSESEDEKQQIKDYIQNVVNVVNQLTSYGRAEITTWNVSDNEYFSHRFIIKGRDEGTTTNKIEKADKVPSQQRDEVFFCQVCGSHQDSDIFCLYCDPNINDEDLDNESKHRWPDVTEQTLKKAALKACSNYGNDILFTSAYFSTALCELTGLVRLISVGMVNGMLCGRSWVKKDGDYHWRLT